MELLFLAHKDRSLSWIFSISILLSERELGVSLINLKLNTQENRAFNGISRLALPLIAVYLILKTITVTVIVV